jgi:predicted NodU family carbamoyl transferase
MKILAFKPGHDGSIAILENGNLMLSLEAEKNSFERHESLTSEIVLGALSKINDIPDVIAVGGWLKGSGSPISESDIGAGYIGINRIIDEYSYFCGKKVKKFSSSHERSHILCSYGMSPFEQGKPCYVLVWEGILGDFYEIDEVLNITHIGKVMNQPGVKYSVPYWIAQNFIRDGSKLSVAGKMMALAGFSEHVNMNKREIELIDFIVNSPEDIWKLKAQDFAWSPFLGIGVESQEFKNLARKISDYIFNQFYEFAKNNLPKRIPLLIGGGCGLNCEWNTKWKESSLFQDVFIPPCTNDSGSAIGTAIDAQFYYSGIAKIEWDVYSGENFVEDINFENLRELYEIYELNYYEIADFISKGNIVAWVQGKYEIGPRALGNRSLLANPLNSEMCNKLNRIKQRENYRPIAPVCLEEDVSTLFQWCGSNSPYMLFFQKLKTDKLPAITHVDGSARVQTVNFHQNEKLYKLIKKFKEITGYGVLCNTSLNFPGNGFINEMSDLIRCCRLRDVDAFVVNNIFYLPKSKSY